MDGEESEVVLINGAFLVKADFNLKILWTQLWYGGWNGDGGRDRRVPCARRGGVLLQY